MPFRVINPAKLSEKWGQKPPKQYDDLKEKIASEKRVLELRCSLENRTPTDEEVRAIVMMKFQLDEILVDWIDPIE
jgi:hypothetical protein